jgi:hypothetical protein
MRLCLDKDTPADALEQATAVLAFLADALCGERDEILEDSEKLWGAQLVFEALFKDLKEIRNLINKSA